jgi:hypothetical protein
MRSAFSADYILTQGASWGSIANAGNRLLWMRTEQLSKGKGGFAASICVCWILDVVVTY